MRVLLFMRDALPPSRADVRVLFDRALRGFGISTDFVGTCHRHGTVPADPAPCHGAMLEAGEPGTRLRWWRAATIALRRARRYDLVIARDLPVAGLPILALARLCGRRTAYWMSFPIPLGDRAGARAHWARRQFVRSAVVYARGAVGEFVQRWCTLRLAQRIFVQSDRMRDEVCRWGFAAWRVVAVPMGVDARRLPAVSATDDTTAAAAGRIVYLGALGRARELHVLIDALVVVRERFPAAHLLLIGAADAQGDIDFLMEHAAQRGVTHAVEVLGARPMPEAWRLAASATVAVSPIPPGPLHDVSSPTKVVEYLALGLPVVASRIPDQEAILRACGGGQCVEFSATELGQGLITVLADPAAARAEASAARQRVLALRSYDVLACGVAAQLRALSATRGDG